MEGRGRIQIMSAGGSLKDTLPRAIKNIERSDKIFVLAEASVYDKKNSRQASISESITKARSIAADLQIPFEVKKLDKIDFSTVQNAILDIYESGPDKDYYFNITGGTKLLALYMFLGSIWIGGRSYYLHESNGKMEYLLVPRITYEDMIRNPNYVEVLRILSQAGGVLSYKIVREKMSAKYHPIRNLDKTTRRQLTKGTLSKWVHNLKDKGLLEIEPPEGLKKQLRITESGKFALKFYTTVLHK